MTTLEGWTYVGPAVFTVDGGPEWSVQADLKTDAEFDARKGELVWTWGGTLSCDDEGLMAAFGKVGAVTLDDGRQGLVMCASYCAPDPEHYPERSRVTVTVLGNGPAPY